MNPPTHTTCANASRHPAASRRGAAFSLMEVLVAMGVFTVGLVAVAAIFPTAITIQRETVREVDGRRIGKNARAMILAAARTNVDPSATTRVDKPQFEMSYTHNVNPALRTGSLEMFVSSATLASATNPTPVLPMIDLRELSLLADIGTQRPAGTPGLTLDAPMSFHGLMNLDTRSYPKNIPQPDRRDYYWYPLLQVSSILDPKFSAFLVVMHRSGTNLPPEVRRSFPIVPITPGGSTIFFNTASGLFNDGTGNVSNDPDGDGLPDFIQPGDIVLGDDGRVHRVILADATSITLNSANVGNPNSIYFGVSMDRATGLPKRESASPVVWIEESIPLSIHN